jgi:hypothetical protein
MQEGITRVIEEFEAELAQMKQLSVRQDILGRMGSHVLRARMREVEKVIGRLRQLLLSLDA